MDILGNPGHGYHAMQPNGNILCGNVEIFGQTVTQEVGEPTCPQCLALLGVTSRTEHICYAVQWHDGDGNWTDDGGAPEGDFETLVEARKHLDEGEYERVNFGYSLRIVKRVTIETDTLVEERLPD